MSGFATIARAILLSALMLTLGACVQDRLYAWNDYEGDLYGYYKDPEKLSELMTALQATIAENEQAARAGGTGAAAKRATRVPPGLYAEYGYLLLVSNRQQEAKEYFQKEKDTWPESSILMDRMIAAASNQPFKAPTVPAGQVSAGR